MCRDKLISDYLIDAIAPGGGGLFFKFLYKETWLLFMSKKIYVVTTCMYPRMLSDSIPMALFVIEVALSNHR